MRQATEGKRNGIQWTLLSQLDDLDFADDMALLSHTHSQMQDKSTAVDKATGQTGLCISIKKTQVSKINATQNEPLKIKGQNLEELETFNYLGSKVNIRGGVEDDVKARIGKARALFGMLSKIWKSTTLSTATKLKIFNSNIKVSCCMAQKHGRQQRKQQAKYKYSSTLSLLNAQHMVAK
jgi:hypothetical protein